MAQFITRVELHDAKWPEDYEKLHVEMQKSGFSKIITSSVNIKYELPTAEYYLNANYTSSSVLGLAKTAAGKIKPKFGVLVSTCNHIEWEGLVPLK